MNEDLNDTTRKFPRTMREAFPEDDSPIEHYANPNAMNWVFAVVYVFAVVVMLLDFFVWRP